MALVGEILYLIGRRVFESVSSNGEQNSSSVTDVDQSYSSVLEVMPTSLTEAICSDQRVGTKNMSMKMRVSSGRPDMDQIATWLMEGKTPSVFYCGPKILSSSIREAVRHQQRRQLPDWDDWRSGLVH